MSVFRGILMAVLVGASIAVQAQAGQASELRGLSRQWARYYAEEYGVSADLVEAIIEEESAWDPYAVSRKGAAGLMQLMPKTAIRFGVQNRFRIDQNVQGGVAYLASLIREFHGDLRLVMAAYYVGESPIEVRGLEYKNRDVHRYVERVAKRYRKKRVRLLAEGTPVGCDTK